MNAEGLGVVGHSDVTSGYCHWWHDLLKKYTAHGKVKANLSSVFTVVCIPRKMGLYWWFEKILHFCVKETRGKVLGSCNYKQVFQLQQCLEGQSCGQGTNLCWNYYACCKMPSILAPSTAPPTHRPPDRHPPPPGSTPLLGADNLSTPLFFHL